MRARPPRSPRARAAPASPAQPYPQAAAVDSIAFRALLALLAVDKALERLNETKNENRSMEARIAVVSEMQAMLRSKQGGKHEKFMLQFNGAGDAPTIKLAMSHYDKSGPALGWDRTAPQLSRGSIFDWTCEEVGTFDNRRYVSI